MRKIEWKDTSAGCKMPYVDGELSTPEVAQLVEQANKFEVWLEQKFDNLKAGLAKVESWCNSAELAYKNNKALLGVEADRGEYNAACDECRQQRNQLIILAEVINKFMELKRERI